MRAVPPIWPRSGQRWLVAGLEPDGGPGFSAQALEVGMDGTNVCRSYPRLAQAGPGGAVVPLPRGLIWLVGAVVEDTRAAALGMWSAELRGGCHGDRIWSSPYVQRPSLSHWRGLKECDSELKRGGKALNLLPAFCPTAWAGLEFSECWVPGSEKSSAVLEKLLTVTDSTISMHVLRVKTRDLAPPARSGNVDVHASCPW